LFNPNRLGRQPDEIERPSVLVAGKREQALRFDPFSVGSHYHIRPSQRGRQIPLWVEEGQTPLDVALAFFDKPLRFRGLLAQADEERQHRDRRFVGLASMPPFWSSANDLPPGHRYPLGSYLRR
jgi:hypothetical protein